MADCTVYIDEAGDLGVNAGTRWFVLTAVIVDQQDEPRIRQSMAKIKSKLNVREIHMRNIHEFFKRAYIVRELSAETFTYMNVLVDTSKFDLTRIPNAAIAYNYICKYLLQRVSGYLTASGQTGDIVLSARGTSRDGELISYITDKLLPFQYNNINASVFHTITAKAASQWELLQLADVCATSMFWSHEVNAFGFCVPCFATALSAHLYQSAQLRSARGYGVKYFQPDMTPDRRELDAKRFCAKKERTPGATAT